IRGPVVSWQPKFESVLPGASQRREAGKRRPCLCRLVGRQRDLDRQFFQQYAPHRQTLNGPTARQVASVERVLIGRSGWSAGRKDEIDERRRTDRESIEVIVAAAIDSI